MKEQQFIIVGEEYVGYTQGNAYIISNGEYKFSVWESKEDVQKVCDLLNELSTSCRQLETEVKTQTDYLMNKGLTEDYSEWKKME